MLVEKVISQAIIRDGGAKTHTGNILRAKLFSIFCASAIRIKYTRVKAPSVSVCDSISHSFREEIK